jgi:endonuclease/exonuclease/phosphatase family metal-dependent hydrolase
MPNLRSTVGVAALSVAVATCAKPIVRTPVPEPAAACDTVLATGGQATDARITWTPSPDDGDAAPLRSWCRGVGPAVIVPAPAADRAPFAAVTSLTVVSWNVHVGGGNVRRLLAALRAGELTHGEPPGQFVLLLQEAWREGTEVPASLPPGASAPDRIAASAVEDIVDVAASEGLALYYVPSMRNGDGPEDRGNAILSTLPLTAFQAIELPFERQRRVAVAASVVLPGTGGSVRVISAHLDATAGAARLWVFASGLRAAQARHLAEAIGTHAPAVLGSDLNTWAEGPREPAVSTLRRAFPQTGAVREVPTFGYGLRLDYVFFRLPSAWTAAAARADDRYDSDHYPLVGRLIAPALGGPG